MEDIDGLRTERTKGTPQGGVISPLISNLFMHYAFDKWMEIHFPKVLFVRYADDLVIHCISEKKANIILSAVRKRLSECFLDLHPTKTKIIYCKDNQRNGTYKVTAFDFLGYTFRPRMVKTKYGNIMTSFTPAIGDKVRKIIQGRIRNWKIHLLSHAKIEEIACSINPVLCGWLNYYCKFYGSLAIHTISRAVNFALVRWARRKFKKLNRSYSRARDLIRRMQKQNSILFEHWKNAKGI